jgi:hypothetical protein
MPVPPVHTTAGGDRDLALRQAGPEIRLRQVTGLAASERAHRRRSARLLSAEVS